MNYNMKAHTTEEEATLIAKIVDLIGKDPSYEIAPSSLLSLQEYLTELTLHGDCKGSFGLGIIFALETYLEK